MGGAHGGVGLALDSDFGFSTAEAMFFRYIIGYVWEYVFSFLNEHVGPEYL